MGRLRDPADRRWWALGLLVLAGLPVVLDGVALPLALPVVERHLLLAPSRLAAVFVCSPLFLLGLLPVRGGRRSLLLGLLGFAAGCLVSAAAAGFGWLLVGRLAAGLGGAVALSGALAVLDAAFPSEERRRAVAIWAGFTGLVAVAGPLPAGLLLGAGWAPLLLVEAVLALLGLAGVLALVPPTPAGRVHRLSRVSPLVAFGFAVLSAMTLLLVLYFADVRGTSPFGTALRLLVPAAALLLVAPRAVAAARRRGPRLVAALGLLGLVVACLGLRVVGGGTALPLVLLLLFVLGAGVGVAVAVGLSPAGPRVSRSGAPGQLGSLLGVVLAGVLLVRCEPGPAAQVVLAGLAHASAVLALLAGLGVLAALRWLPRVPPAEPVDPRFPR